MKLFKGKSLNIFNLNGTSFPLVYSGDAANYTLGADPVLATLCFPGALSPLITKEGIVLSSFLSSFAWEAEAIGIIMPSSFEVALAFPAPVAVISHEDYFELLDYVKYTE